MSALANKQGLGTTDNPCLVRECRQFSLAAILSGATEVPVVWVILTKGKKREVVGKPPEQTTL